MFLYYLINIWKTKQSWLKETLCRLAGWPTCACPDGGFSSRLGRISAKSTEILPRWAGSLLIWTHLYFYMSFFRKVRSHLGEIAPQPSHLTSIWTAPKYKVNLCNIASVQYNYLWMITNINFLKNCSNFIFVASFYNACVYLCLDFQTKKLSFSL